MKKHYEAPLCAFFLLFPGDNVLQGTSSTEPFTEFDIDPAYSPITVDFNTVI